MPTAIALLRGINVGGHNILPMKELRTLLTDLGLEEVRTYIQSGNAIFRHEGTTVDLPGKIAGAIEQQFGFAPAVLVLDAAQMRSALDASPFAADIDPKTLHLFFLEKEPGGPDLGRLEQLKSSSENFALAGRVFYLHAPDGVGRSRLAPQVEKCLGVAVTARNGRTVARLLELAG
jgi:uncharacterized protein (DUF1697 family)